MLMDVMIKENITIKAKVADWKEAIAVSGSTLVDNGAIEEKYIDAMIKVVEELGPYIVIAPGIAIAHARPEDGVKKSGFAITTLKNPVNFGNEANDPVSLVITISAIDYEGHLEALAELMSIIENNENYKEIVKSDSVDEVYNILKGIMK
ncbi:MAG: PTS sugar transporter subunit IIA [Eubacteriales bacterium]